MFREAFAKRRCLIPATGFFECQKQPDGKQPYRITRKDLEPFAFAGIWEFARIGGEEIHRAIIVGDANELVDHYGALAEQGVERVYAWFTDFAQPDTLGAFGRSVAAPLAA